jgi:4-oxalocrotonate tautomerase
MPLIHVSMYPGRTQDQKQRYAKAVTDAAVEILGTKPQHVIVIFEDNPKENWFQSGQQL